MARSTGTTNGNVKALETQPAQNDMEALSAQIATLRSDVSSLAELMGEIGVRRGKAAGETIENKANEARDRGAEALREAGARVAELENSAVDGIRSNPMQAVGLAAAAGFLIGYLGSRRSTAR